ncbi:HEAT repeat domain-containing protein [Spirochaetota bacterium]
MKKIILSILAMTIAVSAIGKEKSAKQYIADLKASNSEKTIILAADWAAKEKEKDAIGNLLKLVNDGRVKVRLHCIMALGYIGEEKAVNALNNALLNDKSAEVRYAALLSTVKIGSKKSIKTWRTALASETDPFVKDFLKKMDEKSKGK